METGIDEETKKKIIALISALLPSAKIYLFGSRATGTHSEWSDIDLAIDAKKKLPRSIVDEIKSIIKGSNIPYKVDVLDINYVSNDMSKSILDEKIIWKK